MIAKRPNAPAHRERPTRGLSAFSQSQRGRDAVAREVRQAPSRGHVSLLFSFALALRDYREVQFIEKVLLWSLAKLPDCGISCIPRLGTGNPDRGLWLIPAGIV